METRQKSAVDDFFERLGSGVVLIDFNAPWCAPCRSQGPIIDQLAEKFRGRATISAVNIDENRDAALKLGIHSIPTLILFKGGREVQRFIGLQSEESLARAIERVL